jgi:SNF2 family DNA or RNA helicase
MPKTSDAIIPVEMGPSARRAYEIFSTEGIIVWKRHMVEAPIPLTKLLRQQQMTGGWVHDTEGETFEFQTEKLAILEDLLQDLRASDRSVLVFARFLAEIEAIVNCRHGYKNIYRIQGKVSQQSRRDYVRDFSNRRPSLMVIQAGAAEALDGLQRDCSEAVFFSSDFSLIHWSQAKGRLDRVGQTRPVTFYHLHEKRSVDSLIFEALQAKKDIEKMVMDNPEILISR